MRCRAGDARRARARAVARRLLRPRRRRGAVRAGAGAALTITVPPRWRTRVGISWGNAGHDVYQWLRFSRCGGDASRGNAYAGGFFLRAPSDCVPLRYAVAGRSRLVWFGVGRRCAG